MPEVFLRGFAARLFGLRSKLLVTCEKKSLVPRVADAKNSEKYNKKSVLVLSAFRNQYVFIKRG